MLNTLHPQPIPPINERTPPLKFTDKIPEILGLAAVVQLLHGALGDDAAVVRVHDVLGVALLLGVHGFGRARALRHVAVEGDAAVVYARWVACRLDSWAEGEVVLRGWACSGAEGVRERRVGLILGG